MLDSPLFAILQMSGILESDVVPEEAFIHTNHALYKETCTIHRIGVLSFSPKRTWKVLAHVPVPIATDSIQKYTTVVLYRYSARVVSILGPQPGRAIDDEGKAVWSELLTNPTTRNGKRLPQRSVGLVCAE